MFPLDFFVQPIEPVEWDARCCIGWSEANVIAGFLMFYCECLFKSFNDAHDDPEHATEDCNCIAGFLAPLVYVRRPSLQSYDRETVELSEGFVVSRVQFTNVWYTQYMP